MRFFREIVGLIVGQRAFVLNYRAGHLLENFFISAVGSILIIRLYIRLFAGSPVTTQLTVRLATESTTADLHFAHVLWGGLLMLGALILALAYLGRSTRELAAILGGIGFGAFIDELGKFITRDNNYFFQPSIALIYLTLVLLFIVIRVLQRPRHPSQRDALANALEVTKLSVIGDAGPEDRAHALALLSHYPAHDPVVGMVSQALHRMEDAPRNRPHILERIKGLLSRTARRLVSAWWFTSAVIAYFVLQSLANLYQTLAAINWSAVLAGWLGASVLVILVLLALRHRSQRLQTLALGGVILAAVVVSLLLLTYRQESPAPLNQWLKPAPPASDIEPGTGFQDRLIDFFEVLQVTAPLISNVLVAFGILAIWHSRLTAYRLFHHAILVSILLTQVFVFLEDQLIGVVGLLPNLVVLAILRYLINSEELSEEMEELKEAESLETAETVPEPVQMPSPVEDV